MLDVTMKSLLEAGVHFGHHPRRWNPKMAPYIFGERGGNYIIDLQKTLRLLRQAYGFLSQTAAQGGRILFVGTKKQARDIIEEESKRCGQYYVNSRWLGGMLTNFQTITKSISRLRQLEEMESKGIFEELPKKEVLQLQREHAKLVKNLAGIKDLGRLPSAIVVVDTRIERIAVAEANKLKIPVIAVVDTNCDPDVVNYPVPGNDDAIRAIRLMVATFANAVVEGRASRTEGAFDEEPVGVTATTDADDKPEPADDESADDESADDETAGDDNGSNDR